MADKPAFRVPEGLRMDLAQGRLDLDYDGDIEIESDPGLPFGRIRAGGDLTIKLARVTGDLSAGGVLRVRGVVDGGSLYGREVVLGRQAVRCRSITAGERITIGAADLAVDVILAPEIAIDAKATGRVTILESANERGPTKIKGGFSLADFEDTFGGSIAFLTERGLQPLAGREPAPIPDADDGTTEADIGLPEETVSLRRGPADPDLHRRFTDALVRITACYDERGPGAVGELRALVEHEDYASVKERLADLWNSVLGYHRKRGVRPHHQVTYAFHLLHGLVS
jgi:hypothetical protein